MPARHCACSAHLVRCPLGTAPPPTEVLQDVRPTYGSLTGKKQGGGHFGVEPHAHDMQNRAKKRASCSTCHAKKTSCSTCCKKNKLFHMSCKKTSCSTCHAKTMQKTSCSTCHAKTMQKTSCSTCCKKPCKTNHAKCGAYGAPTRRTLTLPGFLAICAICAIWPYIAHILQIFARTEYIAHIVHIARSRGRVGVQRLGV